MGVHTPRQIRGLIYVHYQVFATKPSLQFDPSSRDGCVGKGGYFWFQFQGCLECFASQIDYHLPAFNSPFPTRFKQKDGHRDMTRIKESTFIVLKLNLAIGESFIFELYTSLTLLLLQPV